MSPPGLTATTESPGEQITGERVTDLSTKSGQERHLVDGLGMTYPQAKAMLRAYERDLADAHRIGNTTARSDASFIGWLMSQAPGHRNRPVRKWRVGEAGWRTAG